MDLLAPRGTSREVAADHEALSQTNAAEKAVIECATSGFGRDAWKPRQELKATLQKLRPDQLGSLGLQRSARHVCSLTLARAGHDHEWDGDVS